MADPDRLAEITEHLIDHQDIHEDEGWWLIDEVKRLRDEVNARDYGWWSEDVHRNGDPLNETWEPIYPDSKDPREGRYSDALMANDPDYHDA